MFQGCNVKNIYMFPLFFKDVLPRIFMYNLRFSEQGVRQRNVKASLYSKYQGQKKPCTKDCSKCIASHLCILSRKGSAESCSLFNDER